MMKKENYCSKWEKYTKIKKIKTKFHTIVAKHLSFSLVVVRLVVTIVKYLNILKF